MMLRLGIISNPFAKTNKKNPNHNTQMWYSLANEGQYEVTHSLIELEKVCQEFCERKINLVGIVGGDGSIGLVLSYLLKAYRSEQRLPKILLLKGGTINFLASNLGIKTSALDCLKDTLFFIKKKINLHETSVRTIEVNGRLGFLFAGGIASTFLEEYYKNKTNSLGAALFLGKYMLDGVFDGRLNGRFKRLVKPQLFNITTEPNPLWSTKILPNNEEAYTLVFASTVPKLPFNLRLFKKIKLGEASAEMIAITEKGTNLLTGALHAFVGGDITRFGGVDSLTFNKAKISSSASLSYTLDGDVILADDGKIDIKLGPSFIFCSPYYIAPSDTILKGS